MKEELLSLQQRFNVAGSAQRLMMVGEIADLTFRALGDIYRRLEAIENAKG